MSLAMPKTLSLLGGGAALALVLTACGGDDNDDGDATPPDETAPPQEEEQQADLSGELTVWIMEPGNPDVQATIDGFDAAFEQMHQGVTINIDYVPWANAHDQFTTGIAGGQVPDLAEMGNTWTPEFAEIGAFAPVQPPAGVEFVEGLAQSATLDGTTYGYPWYAGARALIYRTDVFEEAGADVPTTWDELLEVGDTIAAETDVAPIRPAGGYQHMFQPLIWNAGGDMATQDGDSWTPGFDTEAGHEALSFFETLWKKGWSPEGAVQWNSVDVRDDFANEEAAMMIGGGWDLRAILGANPELEGRVGTALMPAGPAGNQDAFAGGSNLVVFQQSQQQELAMAFAEFMIEPENAKEFADQIGFLPGTVGGVEETVGGDELFGVFGDQFVNHSRAYPVAGWWGKVEGNATIPTELQRLMLGEVTVEEAAANIDAGIADAIG
jgi:N,N'-diacetylchitobiose transport system substrate-binding protein